VFVCVCVFVAQTHDSVGVKVKDESGQVAAKVLGTQCTCVTGTGKKVQILTQKAPFFFLVTFSPHPAPEAKGNLPSDTQMSSERAGLLPSGHSPAGFVVRP
jgi:hypothetical protein